MEFHDPNRVQKLEQDTATDTTTVIYVVPADKKFYLIEAGLMAAGAAGKATVVIRNGSAAIQRIICGIDVGATTLIAKQDHFAPGWPVELPATWDIAVISDTAALVADGDIFGYETEA